MENKISLRLLPTIATIIYVGLTWLSGFPQIFNYPVQITRQNAARQYSIAVRLLRWLKLVIVVVFACYASGPKMVGLPVWLLPLMLVLSPIIIAVTQMLKRRDNSMVG